MKNDKINENRGDCPEGSKEVPSSNELALDPHLGENCINISTDVNIDQNMGKTSFSGEPSGNINSSSVIDFHLLFIEIK